MGFLEECERVKGAQSPNIIPVVGEDRLSLEQEVLCGHYLSGIFNQA